MSSPVPETHEFGAEELQRMYQTRFGGREDYRTKVWDVLLKHHFQQWVNEGDTVLDLGAGFCEFINAVSCENKYALDLNPDVAQHAGPDVEVLLQDCTEPWPLPKHSLDVVFSSNFFEHLSDKAALGRVFQEAHRCLKPGGRIIAMGPNIKHVPGAYWDFWDHHLPLTEQSLAEGLRQSGFTTEECIDKFLPFTMASGPQYPVFFVALYLKFPLVWRIFGKQFLVIGRKAL